VDGNNYWWLECYNNLLRLGAFIGGTYTGHFLITCPFTPDGSSFYHIEIARNGTSESDWKFFINGVSQTLTLAFGGWNGTITNLAAVLRIGYYEAGVEYFKGHIDDFQIYKGTCLHTSNFTVPTNPISKKLDVFSESTIKTQGSYSLKGVAAITDSLNKALTRTLGTAVDLSGVDIIRFDIRASRTGSNIKIGIHDSGGTTTETTPNITSANTWQTVAWDLSGVADADKDAIDSIIITIANADSANTFYIDNFLSAENVTVTAEPFIVTTDLSSDGAVIFAGFGYVYEEDSTGAVMDIAVRTKAKIGGNLLKRKALKYIYHMMNTHGKDVTMTIYVDGVAQTPAFTINTTVRKMTRIEDIPNFEGYKFDIRLTGESITDSDLEIYSHLALEYVPYGE
jgi:hypothetical protein